MYFYNKDMPINLWWFTTRLLFHDSLICVACLIYVYVWYDSLAMLSEVSTYALHIFFLLRSRTNSTWLICVTWIRHHDVCDMTNMTDMTPSCVWCHSFMCVLWPTCHAIWDLIIPHSFTQTRNIHIPFFVYSTPVIASACKCVTDSIFPSNFTRSSSHTNTHDLTRNPTAIWWICVTWLIHMRDMTPSYAWQDCRRRAKQFAFLCYKELILMPFCEIRKWEYLKYFAVWISRESCFA